MAKFSTVIEEERQSFGGAGRGVGKEVRED